MSPPDSHEPAPDAPFAGAGEAPDGGAAERLAAGDAAERPPGAEEPPSPPRYGRYVGLLAVLILVAITINTFVTKPHGGGGFAPGEHVAPFALPLAVSDLEGDANVATHADQGAAGARPACAVRGPKILNVCELYEHSPVVLALFVNGGACPAVLSDMQALKASFPGVEFAAVSIKGERAAVRRTVQERGLTFPVGIDKDGVLVVLYKQASCPQVTFVAPGGAAHGKALLRHVSRAELRARVEELVAASRAAGWKGPAR